MSGQPAYWGAKWKNHWWVVDISQVDEAGTYICQVQEGDKILLKLYIATKQFEAILIPIVILYSGMDKIS